MIHPGCVGSMLCLQHGRGQLTRSMFPQRMVARIGTQRKSHHTFIARDKIYDSQINSTLPPVPLDGEPRVLDRSM
jgi:hypothetical protein